MALISRPTFRDIAEGVYPQFEDFYKREREHGNRNVVFSKFQDLTTDLLNEILLNAQTSEALVNKSYDHTRQCNRKKKRWELQFMKAVRETPLTSDKNPLCKTIKEYDESPRARRKVIYGDKTREDLVNEFIQMVEEWAAAPANENGWFIDYPLIADMTPRKRYDALCEDIETCLYMLIKEKFGDNMDLSAAMQFYLKEMDQGPIFSPLSRKYRPDSDGTLSIVPTTESGKRGMIITVGSEDVLSSKNLSSISSLDTKDFELFTFILQRASQRSGAIITNPEFMIDTIDLARVLTKKNSKSSNVNNRSYKNVEERIFKLVSLKYSMYREDKDGKRVQYGAINFLSAAISDEIAGRKVMRIILSPMVQDALLNSRLGMFPSNLYNKMDNPYAKVIFTKMQKDRVKAHVYAMGDPDKCRIAYTKSDMMRYINYEGLSKRMIVKEFRNAVKEFQEKGVFVKSFNYDAIEERLHVWFFPLSDDEVADLNRMGLSEEDEEWIEEKSESEDTLEEEQAEEGLDEDLEEELEEEAEDEET